VSKQRTPDPDAPFPVEFRSFIGPIRAIKVTPAQWRGETCIIGKDCSETRTQLHNVGSLCNKASAPGSLEYLRTAYAHMDCLRPEERWVPAHSRCQPTAAPTW
jgi:hypothetical protein